MTELNTWQALGVDALDMQLSKINYTTLYTQYDKGGIIAWCSFESFQGVEKIFQGLNLTQVSTNNDPILWILLGEQAKAEFWPQQEDSKQIVSFEHGKIFVVDSIAKILQDKQRKVLFWHKWNKFLQQL